MTVLYVKRWSVSDVLNNPTCLFIFGDNDVQKGLGGQAIIRNCPNALGIPTKKAPNNNLTSFYTDDEYEQNKNKIDAAIQKIITELSKYKMLVLPEDGLGTGLSKLNTKAPLTFKYLNEQLEKIKKTDK